MKLLKYACLSGALLTLAACGQMGTPLPEVAPDNELAPLDVVTASDVVTLGNTSRRPGYLGSASFHITNENNNAGDPVNSCNASISAPVTVRVTSSDPSKITINDPGYVTLTDCGSDPATVKSIGYQVLSTATEGPVNITGTASGGKNGGTGRFTAGEFTVQITVPAPTDNTAPIITPTIDPSGPNGLNGWYTSDVTIQWNAVDGESAISSNPCASTTIDADTSGTTLTCTATSAGGTSNRSVTIKRDATAPTVAYTSAPEANGEGWYNADVTATFTATDNLSGFGTDTPVSLKKTGTATTSGEGTNVTVGSPTFTDNAGNTAAAGVATSAGYKIDKTAPSLSPSVSPNPVFLNGNATATANASDGLSGLASQNCDAVDTSSVGSDKSVRCTATDKAGNTKSASATYNVVYNFTGFFSPVDMGGIFNVAKAGSAIPVKFKLGGDQGTDVISKITLVKVVCPSTATLDTIEELSSADLTPNVLKYDATAGQYMYNWKTSTALAGTCQIFKMELKDGTVKQANFKFNK